MSYRTITLPFKISNEELSKKVLYTASLWKAGIIKLLNEIKQLEYPEIEFRKSIIRFKNDWYRIPYSIIPDQRYSHSCCEVVYEIGKSLLEVSRIYMEESCTREDWFYTKLNEVELKDWIMFESRGDSWNVHGNKNIRLIKVEKNLAILQVKLFDYKKVENFEIIQCKIKGRRWKYMLENILELANTVVEKKKSNKRYGIEYNARVYIHHVDPFTFKLIGVIQIAIPEWLYYLHYEKLFEEKYVAEYSLGVDVNFDRINFVLIDSNFNIIDMKHLDITKFVTQGRDWKGVRTYLAQFLHYYFYKLSKEYKFIVSVEDPEKLGLYKLEWMIKGLRLFELWNYKVSRFTCSLTEVVIDLAKRLGIHVETVNPKGTSSGDEHEQIMKKLGLDRHMASAYLIAKRGLEKLKQII